MARRVVVVFVALVELAWPARTLERGRPATLQSDMGEVDLGHVGHQLGSVCLELVRLVAIDGLWSGVVLPAVGDDQIQICLLQQNRVSPSSRKRQQQEEEETWNSALL